MKKVLLLLTIGLLSFGAYSAQSEPVHILLITGGHEFEEPQFYAMFDSFEGVTYDKAVQPAANEMFADGSVMKYDAVVLYDMWKQITPEQKAGYLSFLNAGKGLLALHHNIAAYPDWPEYTGIIGGIYCEKPMERDGKQIPAATYLHDVDLKMTIADKSHPITEGVGDFEIHDETYKGLYVVPDAHVLVTTDHPTSSREIAWTVDRYLGRTAYIQMGHDHQAYENPNYRRLVSNAIHWVAAQDGWTSLFDGKSLDGWKQINGTAKYEVDDGTILGWTSEGSPNSFLCTTRDYGDFILDFDVKVDPRLNSGVQIRSESSADYQNHRVHGYQVEIAAGGFSGYIYDEARRAKFLNENTDREKAESAFNGDDWNHYRIVCKGDSIRTWINGKPIEDLKDGMTASGFIGLQVHAFNGDKPAWVRWKNIRIKEL